LPQCPGTQMNVIIWSDIMIGAIRMRIR